MDEEYSVPLQSLIDEFSFEPVCLPRPASEIYVKTTELNRPGLALSGFFIAKKHLIRTHTEA